MNPLCFPQEAYPDKRKIKRMSKKFGVSCEKLMCWYQYYQKKLERAPKQRKYESNFAISNCFNKKKHKFEKKRAQHFGKFLFD